MPATGVFPETAPSTVRIFNRANQGQISVEHMIDRYKIDCRSVRDLLVDYLRERQLSVDYTSLRAVAFGLGKLFWKDLENHHPGIDSLRLAPDVAAAWKQRIAMKTIRGKTASGETVESETPRADRGINYVALSGRCPGLGRRLRRKRYGLIPALNTPGRRSAPPTSTAGRTTPSVCRWMVGGMTGRPAPRGGRGAGRL
jgi:hypothetical protein